MGSKPDLSAAIQDYLKEIYKLEAEGTRPTTTAIARRMGVAPSSATSMLKKLAALGLAEHSPYHGVELSDSGRKIALEVIRHHRLLEQYLAETLGLPIDAVHAEADACEIAMRARAAGRVATDEVFVRGEIPDDIRRAVLTVDPHAVIRSAAEGWSEVTLDGPDARDRFARLSALRLPDPPGYVQGDVARVAARVFVDVDAIHVLVPASRGAYLRRRVEEVRAST